MSILGILRSVFGRDEYEDFRQPNQFHDEAVPSAESYDADNCRPYEIEFKTDKEKAFNEFLYNLPSAPGTVQAHLSQSRSMDVMHGGWRREFSKTDPYYLTFEEKRAMFEEMWEARKEQEEDDLFADGWDTQVAREMNERNRHNARETKNGLWEGQHPGVRDNRYDAIYGHKFDPIPVSLGRIDDLPQEPDVIEQEESDFPQPYVPSAAEEKLLYEIERAEAEWRWNDYNRLVKEYCGGE